MLPIHQGPWFSVYEPKELDKVDVLLVPYTNIHDIYLHLRDRSIHEALLNHASNSSKSMIFSVRAKGTRQDVCSTCTIYKHSQYISTCT